MDKENTMKKLSLAVAVVALLATLVLAGAGRAGKTLTLKIATLSPDGTSLMRAADAAGSEIQQATQGRVKLKVYPGGVMGNDETVMRKMRAGQIHGSTFTSGGVKSFDINYQLLSLPMLLRNYREVDAVRAKVEDRMTQSLADKGFVTFGIMEAGFAYMMSNSPIHSKDDLNGRKVWIPEGDLISRRVFEKLGVPPVQLPLADVLTGLQTGLVDTVANSPIGTVVFQWFTKVKYFTETPLLYTYGTIGFPSAVWNKIDPEDQAIVRDVLTRYSKKIDRQNRLDNEKAMVTLKKQGLTFNKIDPSRLPEMEKLSEEAIDELVAEGKFDPVLLGEIRAIVQGLR